MIDKPLYRLYNRYMEQQFVPAMTVNDLVEESYDMALDKGWWDKDRSIPELLALVHSEVSEALEDHRAGRPFEEIYYEGDKPCGVCVELADVVIRIADMFGRHDVDMAKVLDEKLNYNSTREYRHGGKVL